MVPSNRLSSHAAFVVIDFRMMYLLLEFIEKFYNLLLPINSKKRSSQVTDELKNEHGPMTWRCEMRRWINKLVLKQLSKLQIGILEYLVNQVLKCCSQSKICGAIKLFSSWKVGKCNFLRIKLKEKFIRSVMSRYERILVLLYQYLWWHYLQKYCLFSKFKILLEA